MMVRAFTIDDYDEVKKLHEKYYSEFDFPRFTQMLNAFVIEDNKGIIMAGGVEKVAEAVLVTNKIRNGITLGRALVEAQLISVYTCQKFGIRDIYAFVNDEKYAKHLIKHGFSEHGLKTLSMKVPEGN